MCYQKRQYNFFVNRLDSNTTNIAKDTFIIPTEDIHKKEYLGEKVLTLQKTV